MRLHQNIVCRLPFSTSKMCMMKLTLMVLIFVVCIQNGYSQSKQEEFITQADSLAQILFSDAADSIKILVNEELRQNFKTLLHEPESQTFPFDSLTFVRFLAWPDGKFSLLSWVVPLAQREFLYSGFIQKMNNGKIDTVIELKPTTADIMVNEKYSSENWPGAVYTKIIGNATKGKEFFTLLGWQGKGEGLSGRIIETLWFDQQGNPVFGLPVFKMKSGNLQHRHIFEFTDQVPFHLAYERHRLPKEKRKTDWMIVFNRLSGNQPGMGRFFNGAVPSYEVFDAFIFIGNQWVLTEDVDPRVDSQRLPNQRPREMNLSPER